MQAGESGYAAASDAWDAAINRREDLEGEILGRRPKRPPISRSRRMLWRPGAKAMTTMTHPRSSQQSNPSLPQQPFSANGPLDVDNEKGRCPGGGTASQNTPLGGISHEG